jgi:hypothetical protein
MTVQEYVSSLLEIQDISHIAHLQTSSFSEHKALNELYDGIVDQFDAYVEAYQGKYGIIKGYKSFKLEEGVDMVDYLKEKMTSFETYKSTLTDGYLQQMVDNTQELLSTTLYKLRFLS